MLTIFSAPIVDLHCEFVYQFDNYQLTPEVKMSSSISQFYTRIVGINKDFSPQKQEDKRLKRNFELYENNDERFKSLCQKNDQQQLVFFFINMAVNNQSAKKEWENDGEYEIMFWIMPNVNWFFGILCLHSFDRRELAWKHLQCFCEESCYWAAKKIADKENDSALRHELIQDFLDYGKEFIYGSANFRKKIIEYNIKESYLQTYMQAILSNVIKNKPNSHLLKRSSNQMLLKASNSTLKIALTRFGFSHSEISKIIFAHQYWKTVYRDFRNSATRKGESNNCDLDYQEIAKSYNSEKKKPGSPIDVSEDEKDITPQEIQQWMQKSIYALCSFYKPKNQSFEEIRGKLELEGFGDEFEYKIHQYDPSLNESNEVRHPEDVTENNIFNQIKLTVTQTLKDNLLSIKPLHRKRIILYYGSELNQEQIAEILSVTQGAIARSLIQSKQRLKVAFLSTKIDELHKASEWVSNYVEKWLEAKCQIPINFEFLTLVIEKTAKNFNQQERKLLQLKYGEKFDDLTIPVYAKKLGITVEELDKSISKVEAKLEKAVLEKIHEQIEKYLDFFLRDECEKIIDQSCLRLSLNKQEMDWNNINLVNSVLEESINIMIRDE